MHALVDEVTGPKLQRRMREAGPTSFHASLLLESGLGASVEELCDRSEWPRTDIENLIVRFNAIGMKGIRQAAKPGARNAMNAGDIAVAEEMIRLTPEAFGYPDHRWITNELCAELEARNLVGCVDRSVIRELLEANRPRRANRAKRGATKRI